ncbi:hypothetical protein L249_5695 [Ophiocordyceps polyrhachis-furcata BCC 54312]|uniref:Inositolphosphotransferase Aur1/Ipt1 domain-containing protein n=1 Tax=Ophiocordyceps polyrhachis-furcata BCC 54312 TaxID=1330021 RepID=A0A367KZY3_9HYPO|nr:hypothetical protein L249_5695 [Ophiocordyceps polyrhachis-furcata BCC 54312]
MALGAVLEPAIVVTLLFGGAWINRRKGEDDWPDSDDDEDYDDDDDEQLDENADGDDAFESRRRSGSSCWSASSSTTLATTELSSVKLSSAEAFRCRRLRFFGWEKAVRSPNTVVFRHRLLSRLLDRFPFLVEAWYWALIYWVYQLGRAFTALTLVDGTVTVARKHALQLIHLEQRLGIFVELPVQKWFLARPLLLHWINRLYSFIHIPGTIFFLVCLFYITTTRRSNAAGPALYEARRRTMAMCNLLAFVIFTLWPCMPPRLLSDADYKGDEAVEAKSYGFVDTVHGSAGESSVWTTNRFCNQYAAMPSLHFGYSLLIGLTVATLPVSGLRWTSWKRIAMATLGMAYPTLILTAIVATANHFLLDAVAGAMVCGLAWQANGLLLNLSVLEDYFLWFLRIHKPVHVSASESDRRSRSSRRKLLKQEEMA